MAAVAAAARPKVLAGPRPDQAALNYGERGASLDPVERDPRDPAVQEAAVVAGTDRTSGVTIAVDKKGRATAPPLFFADANGKELRC